MNIIWYSETLYVCAYVCGTQQDCQWFLWSQPHYTSIFNWLVGTLRVSLLLGGGECITLYQASWSDHIQTPGLTIEDGLLFTGQSLAMNLHIYRPGKHKKTQLDNT